MFGLTWRLRGLTKRMSWSLGSRSRETYVGIGGVHLKQVGGSLSTVISPGNARNLHTAILKP